MIAIDNILNYLQGLSKKEFEKFLMVALGSIMVIVGIFSYYIYRKSSALEQHIQNVYKERKKAKITVATYHAIQRERKRLLILLEKEKKFEIKSFFEKFCRDRDIKPESDWSTPENPISGNEQLIEIVLRATFRKQTTEKMVALFADLTKKEIVYIKELIITKDTEGNTITFELAIATIAYRQRLEG